MVFDRSVVIESNTALRREVVGSNTVWFKHHAPLKHYCCQGVKRKHPPVERARASIQTPAQKQSNIVKCHILFAQRICHLEDDMPLRGLVRQLQLHLVTVATLL